MDDAFVRPTKDVLAHFKVAEQSGLSPAQVQGLRAQHGPNGVFEHDCAA